MFDSLCSVNKTNATNWLHIGLVLLSDVQPLHNAFVLDIHFLPLYKLFSEPFQASALKHLFVLFCMPFVCVWSLSFKDSLALEAKVRRPGNKTGN